MLYRLQKESGGYLSVEVIGDSVQNVVERFEEFARAKCKRSGGDWAEDEIAQVRRAAEDFERGVQFTMFEEVTPGVTVDGEMFFV